LPNCIKEEGNDSAHAGSLTKEDTQDLLDLTVALLERLIIGPKKVKLAEERRPSSTVAAFGDRPPADKPLC
jgi:hypothetical protein